MPNFWVKGSGNYIKALRTEYDAKQKALQTKLRQCQDPVEQQALAEELETLKKDFQQRLRGCGRCLF